MPTSATTQTLTLPGAIGAPDTVLQTNGAGVLSWAAVGGGGPTIRHVTTQFPGNANRINYSSITGDIRIYMDVSSWGSDPPGGAKEGNQIRLPDATAGNIGTKIELICLKNTAAQSKRQLRIGLLNSSSTVMYGAGVVTADTSNNEDYKSFAEGGNYQSCNLRTNQGGAGMAGTVVDFHYIKQNCIFVRWNAITDSANPSSGLILHANALDQVLP